MPLTLNGTTGVAGIDGSASTPSIQGTDTNTGVWFPAADTVAIATNGTERMRIDASGNVLVGASTAGSAGLNVAAGYNISFAEGSANTTYTNFFRQSSSGAAVIGYGLKYSATANAFASSVGSSIARSAIVADGGAIKLYTDSASTVASGTNITPTERVRIDSSGNVGIGTTSPATGSRLTIEGTASAPSTSNAFAIRNSSDGGVGISFINSVTDANNPLAMVRALVEGTGAGTNDGVIQFATALNGTCIERARITSVGDFCVGTNTPTAGARFTAFSAGFQTTLSALYNGTDAGTPVIRTYHQATSGSARLHIYFSDGTTNGVGSITSNGISTAYNTSSDYRLKEDVQPMDNGLAIVTALKPVTYTWKADGSRGEGFIAHELAEHVPLAVIGEKDAVDSDGAIKAQAVDYSKIVVHLTAAIQELNAKVEGLQAEINALKGAA